MSKKLDEFHYHELLHATNMIMEICEEHLLNHHVGHLYENEIGDICQRLSNLYGKICIDSDEKFNDADRMITKEMPFTLRIK